MNPRSLVSCALAFLLAAPPASAVTVVARTGIKAPTAFATPAVAGARILAMPESSNLLGGRTLNLVQTSAAAYLLDRALERNAEILGRTLPADQVSARVAALAASPASVIQLVAQQAEAVAARPGAFAELDPAQITAAQLLGQVGIFNRTTSRKLADVKVKVDSQLRGALNPEAFAQWADGAMMRPQLDEPQGVLVAGVGQIGTPGQVVLNDPAGLFDPRRAPVPRISLSASPAPSGLRGADLTASGLLRPALSRKDPFKVRQAKAFATTVLYFLKQAYLNDGEARVAIARAARDSQVIDIGLRSEDPRNALRADLLSVIGDKVRRRWAVASLLAQAHQRSDAMEAAILQAQKQGTVAPEAMFDVWNIGAGIHDSIFQSIATNEGYAHRLGTGELTDLIAATFAQTGDVLQLNSPTRAASEEAGAQLGGDLNFLPGGPFQVRDIDKAGIPQARSLAEVTTLNRATSGGEILFKHRIVKVRAKSKGGADRASWPLEYQIELNNARGQKLFVYSNAVVETSGLGVPSFRVADEWTNELVDEADRANENDPAGAPSKEGILNDNTFFRSFNASDTPMRPYAGKRVAVVGAGDTGNVVVETLGRLASQEAYGRDVSRIGTPRLIRWIGPSYEDCISFAAQNRPRYLAISRLLPKKGVPNSGLVRPIKARPQSVRRIRVGADGTTVLARQQRDGSWLDTLGDPITLLPGTVAFEVASVGPDGRTTAREIFDVVITATGQAKDKYARYDEFFERDGSGAAFSASNPIADSDRVEEVRTTVDGAQAVVAKRLVGTRIYFAGTAAGRLAAPSLQAGVGPNKESIFALGKLTAAFTKTLLGGLLTPAGLKAPSDPQPVEVGLLNRRGEAVTLQREYPGYPARDIQAGQDVFFQSFLQAQMARFNFPRMAQFRLVFTRSGGRLNADGELVDMKYTLEVEPGIDKAMELGMALNREPLFLEVLASKLSGEENRLTVTMQGDSGAAMTVAKLDMAAVTQTAAPAQDGQMELFGQYVEPTTVALPERAPVPLPRRGDITPAAGPKYVDAGILAARAMSLRDFLATPEARSVRDKPTLAKLYTLASYLGVAPETLVSDFISFRDSIDPQSFDELKNLSALEVVELFLLARTATPAIRPSGYLGYALQYGRFKQGNAREFRNPDAVRELYVLSQVQGFDARQRGRTADLLKSPAFAANPDSAALTLLAGLKFANPADQFVAFEKFKADARRRYPKQLGGFTGLSDAGLRSIFALEFLADAKGGQLLALYFEQLASDPVFARLDEKSRLAVLATPATRKGVVPGRNALFF